MRTNAVIAWIIAVILAIIVIVLLVMRPGGNAISAVQTQLQNDCTGTNANAAQCNTDLSQLSATLQQFSQNLTTGGTTTSGGTSSAGSGSAGSTTGQ